jgi:hypothetical protein
MEQLVTVSNYSNRLIDDYILAHEETVLSWTPFIVAVPIYLAFLLIGTQVMRKRPPVNCNKALGYHNLVLFVLSVAMFVGSVAELIVSSVNNGFYETYCGGTIPGQENIYKGRLWFWAFLFYASKYYELFDTVFIVLKKRPLLFLHVYHHIIIIALCLYFLRERVVYFENGVLANALIHSFMYWYYYKAAQGTNIWWKKYLTTAQIIQFFYGMMTFMPFPWVCNVPYSLDNAAFRTWAFNQGVMVSFILLFSNFYQKTYTPSDDDKKKK